MRPLVMLSALAFLGAAPLGSQAVPVLEKRGKCDGISGVVNALTGLVEGFATFFHPESNGGAIGSCGPRANDHSRIVALNSAMYGDMNKKSRHCGRKVLIQSGDRSTIATVTDACPGCCPNSLDLTPDVFRDLGDLSDGVLHIKWCFLGTPGCVQHGASGGKANKGHKGSKDDEDDENT